MEFLGFFIIVGFMVFGYKMANSSTKRNDKIRRQKSYVVQEPLKPKYNYDNDLVQNHFNLAADVAFLYRNRKDPSSRIVFYRKAWTHFTLFETTNLVEELRTFTNNPVVETPSWEELLGPGGNVELARQMDREQAESRAKYAKNTGSDKLPRVPMFVQLAMVLTEDGDYDSAVHVCEKALAWGFDDGTKTGFAGRIDRIRKKAEKANK